ncbi:MAG: hypothetical protein M3Q76_09225, partial [Acidobacteriota bacterium]|nr:hypothetical protein [Acidobacteriota bacterium]
VNLVMDEQLEESIGYVKRAQSLLPGRPELNILLGQIYLRQRDLDSARRALESAIRQITDAELRAIARSLLDQAEAGDVQVSQFRSTVSATVAGAGGTIVETGRVKSGEFEIDISGPMPTVEQVLEKYVEALGGRAALGKFDSRLLKGKVDIPGEFRGAALEIYAKAPNKFLTVINVPGMGVFRQGSNGGGGWAQASNDAARKLTGAEVSELQRGSSFYAPLSPPANYPKMKLLGKVKIGYRDAFLVEAMAVGREPSERFFFDAQSRLLIRRDGMHSSIRGRGNAVIYFDEWTEVDGVKLPFRVTQAFSNHAVVFMFEEVKYNVPFNEQIFNQPVTK